MPSGHQLSGLAPAPPPLGDRAQRPTANALMPGGAATGPSGGEVSPPTQAIGSGEQRSRPADFSDRAELVI